MSAMPGHHHSFHPYIIEQHKFYSSELDSRFLAAFEQA